MKRLSFASCLAALAALSCMASVARAHSDIEVELEGTQLEVHADITAQTGQPILEGDLGEFSDPPGTNDPGFEVEDGTFSEGDNLSANLIGSLMFWDNTQWLSTTPNGEQFRIFTLAFDRDDEQFVDDTGVLSGDNEVLVGTADPEGGIHDHIGFQLLDSSGGSTGTIATGAYKIEMEVLSTNGGFTNSDPFFLVFNNGLSEADFEAGVDALVPEPTALAIAGVGGLVLLARRRAHRA